MCSNFVGGIWSKFNFLIFIYKDKTMSKEMREQINKVKNFGQFLNENKTEQYNSFIINVKYDVGYCDIDTKNIENIKSILLKFTMGPVILITDKGPLVKEKKEEVKEKVPKKAKVAKKQKEELKQE